MPLDLIFVRHGHSEGNLAMEAAKKGDHSLITEEFREIPGHQWHLTADGREQAITAGEWIRKNISPHFDRYYCSPFVRTCETAGFMDLPAAEWRVDLRLRERDWGEINSVPKSEHETRYPHNARVKRIDALYWRPPAGESIADVRLRVRSLFDTLHRECADQTVIVVTHGEFISAARANLEYLSDQEWVERDTDKAWKIHNTHVYHYTRRDPATGAPGTHISWVRAACPWMPENDTQWREIVRRRYSNSDLLEMTASPQQLAN